MHSSDLSQIRKSYELAKLDESNVETNPIAQFERWFSEALKAGVPEPNAMTLATVDAQHRPSTRVVLIKGVDALGFVWYTNYQSRKAGQLASNPYAALQFHWAELERQVLIEGIVEKVDATLSDAYFATRPLGSQWGAIASPQSQVIANRQTLEALVQQAKQVHGEHPVRPMHWGGYRLVPHRVEFWQGRADRLHDRICYQKDAANQWQCNRLAP